MIETLLTLLCFTILVIYVKFQDGSINLDDFKNDSHQKQRYKPRKHYLDDVNIPDPYNSQDLSREFYVNHLMSEKWKQTKLTRLLIDDFKCKQCNKPITAETSHCHHITYQNLGDEGMKDVVSVCPKCHNDIHEFYGKNAGHYPLIKR
mgnify:FL=1